MRNINYYLLMVLGSITLLSCSRKDRVFITITEFSKSQTVVVEPYGVIPYSMVNIKVKGYVNDTIKIIQGPGLFDIYLYGELDTIRKIEYYGEGPRTFIIDPYKGSEGKLEIEFNLK
ncbi:MAG: hypothetical protein ABJ092_02045 [Gillisia sp.]